LRANASCAAVAKSTFVNKVKLGDIREHQTKTKPTAPVQQKTIGNQAVYLPPSNPTEKLDRKCLPDEITGSTGAGTDLAVEMTRKQNLQLRITTYSKRWWDEDLSQALKDARRKRRTARVDPTDENKEEARKATNDFHRLVKQKKREHGV
jgi:hypothetical protein